MEAFLIGAGGTAQSCGWRIAAGFLAALALAACSLVQEPLESDLASPSSEVRECAGWFIRLDAAVDAAGVRDAEAFRIPGYPYLRASRFLASFREQAAADPGAFAAWAGHLRQLDARARHYELANLPSEIFPGLGIADASAASAQSDRCGQVLMALDAATPARRQALTERAQVPDDYSDWKRVVGLYPLVRLPFLAFVKSGEQEAAEAFRAVDADDPPGRYRRYVPNAAPTSISQVAQLLGGAPTDALGIPQLGPQAIEFLLASFAPVYKVETGGEHDRFGALAWGDREAPVVDASRPMAYGRLAFSRYRGKVLPQLVYTIWFSERPASSWVDPTAGTLDGLIFRITLDAVGRPLIYDTIHPCGCYHMFFPTDGVRLKPEPNQSEEWAFVPRSGPSMAPPGRILLRLSSGNHYLTGIETDAGGGGESYALADEAVLRMLRQAGNTRSAFGPDGIVAGSERLERLAVWPLGVDNAGAMREWGHHATALVGRRHFDDADLIERRFELAPVTATQTSDRPRGG